METSSGTVITCSSATSLGWNSTSNVTHTREIAVEMRRNMEAKALERQEDAEKGVPDLL